MLTWSEGPAGRRTCAYSLACAGRRPSPGSWHRRLKKSEPAQFSDISLSHKPLSVLFHQSRVPLTFTPPSACKQSNVRVSTLPRTNSSASSSQPPIRKLPKLRQRATTTLSVRSYYNNTSVDFANYVYTPAQNKSQSDKAVLPQLL